MQPGEECDDGNLVDGDGCNSSCEGEGARLLSRGQPATQSSTQAETGTSFGRGAALAVDGTYEFAPRCADSILDGYCGTHAATSSTGELNPWWQVDLGAVRSVESVDVYRRTDDCCRARTGNFAILVSDDGDSWTEVARETGIAERPTSYRVEASGRFLRIQKLDTGPSQLNLVEVDVFGN